MDDDELFSAARGVIALPGKYTVKMTVAGQSYSQPLTVTIDPRVKTPAADLQKQFEAASAVAHSQAEIADTQHEVQQLLKSARELRPQAQTNAALAAALDALIQKADDIAGPPPGPYGIVPSKPANQEPALSSLAAKFAQIFSAINNGDAAPTVDAMQAFHSAQTRPKIADHEMERRSSDDLPALNAQLKQGGLAPIVIDSHKPPAKAPRRLNID